MQKFFNAVIKVCQLLLAFFLTVLVAVTFWQVLCRFLLKIPAAWTEELIRISFIWLILIGSVVAAREGTHLALDIVTSKLRGNAKHISNVFVLLFMMAVSGLMFVGGLEYVMRSAGKTAVTMRIPANCSYVSVPAASAFMFVFLMEKLMAECKRWRKEKTA